MTDYEKQEFWNALGRLYDSNLKTQENIEGLRVTVADVRKALAGVSFPRGYHAELLGEYQAIAIDMPNPHVVIELDDDAALAALDLATAPLVTPALPEGQNVEFIVRTGPSRLRMRVHERGVGETRSCGTGICAAVVVAAGENAGHGEWLVDIPGGQCRVSWTTSGSVVLTGPAVLIAEVELAEDWTAAHR